MISFCPGFDRDIACLFRNLPKWRNVARERNSNGNGNVPLRELTDVGVLQFAAYSRLALQLMEVARRQLLCVDDFGGELEIRGLLHAALHDREGAPA